MGMTCPLIEPTLPMTLSQKKKSTASQKGWSALTVKAGAGAVGLVGRAPNVTAVDGIRTNLDSIMPNVPNVGAQDENTLPEICAEGAME